MGLKLSLFLQACPVFIVMVVRASARKSGTEFFFTRTLQSLAGLFTRAGCGADYALSKGRCLYVPRNGNTQYDRP